MTDTPRRSLAELLGNGVAKSEPIDLEINGKKTQVRFRELTQTKADACHFAAVQYVENERRRQESIGGHEWRDAQITLETLRMNRYDLLLLHASLLDPEKDIPAVESLDVLERNLSTVVQEYLAEQYEAFRASLDPDNVTEDEIKAVIEDVKKNGPSASRLTRCGYKRLIGCIIYLVNQLSTSQTE